MLLSPVILFVYNRLDHTKATIIALQNNTLARMSDLIIFSDGPKDKDNFEKVQEVRKYIKEITGFKSVKVINREKNYGLANSIIFGITSIINKYGKVIVLEDDLVTSSYFLQYMNDALDKYKDRDEIISIHGYIYPIKNKLPETFFIKGADCWGWATWKRGWDLFEPNGRKLLYKLQTKKLTKEFDFDGSYPYSLMLKSQIQGFNNSWAIRWYASAFLANKLTLYPGRSLIQNIGFDNSGIHSGKNKYFDVNINKDRVVLDDISIIEDILTKKLIKDYFLSFRMIFAKFFMRARFLKKVLVKYL